MVYKQKQSLVKKVVMLFKLSELQKASVSLIYFVLRKKYLK